MKKYIKASKEDISYYVDSLISSYEPETERYADEYEDNKDIDDFAAGEAIGIYETYDKVIKDLKHLITLI